MKTKRFLISVFILILSLSITKLNNISRNTPSYKKTVKVVSEEHKHAYDTYKIQPPNKPGLLTLEIFTIDKDHINIIITDDSTTRFKIPEEDPFPYSKTKGPGSLIHPNFRVKVTEDPFSISIFKLDSEEIFKLDTENFEFVFEENYLDFSVLVPSKYLYGLGERIMDFKFQPGLLIILPLSIPTINLSFNNP